MLRTKLFRCLFITVALTGAVYTYLEARQKDASRSFYMALKHIESLAQGESGDGTPTKTCYKDGLEDYSSQAYIKCHNNTSNSMIYPCPSLYTPGMALLYTESLCTVQ